MLASLTGCLESPTLQKLYRKRLELRGNGGKAPLTIASFAALLSAPGAPAVPLKCLLMSQSLGLTKHFEDTVSLEESSGELA